MNTQGEYMTIFIRLIQIILLFEVSVNAQDYSMSKYETDDC